MLRTGSMILRSEYSLVIPPKSAMMRRFEVFEQGAHSISEVADRFFAECQKQESLLNPKLPHVVGVHCQLNIDNNIFTDKYTLMPECRNRMRKEDLRTIFYETFKGRPTSFKEYAAIKCGLIIQHEKYKALMVISASCHYPLTPKFIGRWRIKKETIGSMDYIAKLQTVANCSSIS